jgi:hypothetical protein
MRPPCNHLLYFNPSKIPSFYHKQTFVPPCDAWSLSHATRNEMPEFED